MSEPTAEERFRHALRTTVADVRPTPSLQVLRDPKVLAALKRAIDEYTEDGDDCTDAAACFGAGHDDNRSHPQEFLDWLMLHTKPPPRPRPALSQDRRARWARKHKAMKRQPEPGQRRAAKLAEVA